MLTMTVTLRGENKGGQQSRLLKSVGRLYHSACMAGNQRIFLDCVYSMWFALYPIYEPPQEDDNDPTSLKYIYEEKKEVS